MATFDGTEGNDTLVGEAGPDTLNGLGGDDIMDGGGGADTINGGDGTDTVTYGSSASGVTVDLNAGTGTTSETNILTAANITNPATQVFNPANGHIYEWVDTAVSWDSALTLAAAAYLGGVQGYLVTITSTAEQDFIWSSFTALFSRPGIAIYLAASDAAVEGEWRWMAGPEAGSLATDFRWSTGEPNNLGNEDYAVMWSIEDGSINDFNNSGARYIVEYSSSIDTPVSDTLSSIENVIGSQFDDSLTGNLVANVLDGGAGQDTILGGGGADTLIGGAGNDALDGGDGIDTASYTGALSGVAVDLKTGLASGGHGDDTLVRIENVTGSAFNDKLSGYQDANVFDGAAGDDQLSGFGGDDSLIGGLGNDILTGGAGNDTVDGGAGRDTASYKGAIAGGGVSVNLLLGVSSGAQGIDNLISIENIIGSAYDDTLIGNNGANVISGGAGNDTLLGGKGIDTASYSDAISAVSVNLNTGVAIGGAGSDTLSGFENIVGSDFNDALTGDAGANVLTGGKGGDTLDGGDGSDTANYADAGAAVVADLSLGTATVGAAPGALQASDITDPATQFYNPENGHIYQIVNQPDTWENAMAYSSAATIRSVTGHLVTITSAAEQSFIEQHIPSDMWLAWLGASDAETEGVWKWVAGPEAGQLMTYSNWDDSDAGGYPAQPFGGVGENYAAIGGQTVSYYYGVDSPYKWVDGPSISAGQGVGYIIEFSGPATVSDTDALINIENLIGSKFNDTLTGNSVANSIEGGRGSDLIAGGGGADILTGGAGKDVFLFTSVDDSSPLAMDLLTDLGNKDKINLGAIDADTGVAGNQAFQQTGAFTGNAGELVLSYNAGTDQTTLALDINGDAVADFALLISGSHLSAADWIL